MSVEHIKKRGPLDWANDRYMDLVRAHWKASIREALAWTLAFLGLGGAIYMGTQNKIRSHVTRIDGSGAIIDRFWTDTAPEVTERDIQMQLALFVEKCRGVTSDLYRLQADIEFCYALAGGEVREYLNSYYNTPGTIPHERAKTQTVAAKPYYIAPPVVDSDTWRVQWNEEIRNAGMTARMVRVTQWEAELRVKVIPPTTEHQVVSNPFGITVIGVTWRQLPAQQQGPQPGAVAAVAPEWGVR
jgi:type IV secretory pathway TrbF-like protein